MTIPQQSAALRGAQSQSAGQPYTAQVQFGTVIVQSDSSPTVVVLTALELEYQAVRLHLMGSQPRWHEEGTLFEVGQLPDVKGSVAIAITGQGNPNAGILAERAIAMFKPQALLFVGVAGALKSDIHLGDIVVGTKVYAYHGGKDEDEGFLARPRAWEAPHGLDQIARHVAREGSWSRLLKPEACRNPPSIHFKPVAAGEVVLNSRETTLAHQLHRNYNDAVAIEMESVGISQAGHLNRSVPVLTIRGISDKADGAKHVSDDVGWQPMAAAHAAAFAITLAGEILREATRSSSGGPAFLPRAARRGRAIRRGILSIVGILSLLATLATVSVLRSCKTDQLCDEPYPMELVMPNQSGSTMGVTVRAVCATNSDRHYFFVEKVFNVDPDNPHPAWYVKHKISPLKYGAVESFSVLLKEPVATRAEFSVISVNPAGARALGQNLARDDAILQLPEHLQESKAIVHTKAWD